jgi:hypothetical protein
MNCRLSTVRESRAWYFAATISIMIFMGAIQSGAASVPSAGASTPVLRCGWFDNPSPSNVWLNDRDGEWTIGIQGGHQAKGNWPKFKPAEWIRSGSGSYGYGCACLKLQANAETRDVMLIISATARPITACRNDPALKGKEPSLR